MALEEFVYLDPVAYVIIVFDVILMKTLSRDNQKASTYFCTSWFFSFVNRKLTFGYINFLSKRACPSFLKKSIISFNLPIFILFKHHIQLRMCCLQVLHLLILHIDISLHFLLLLFRYDIFLYPLSKLIDIQSICYFWGQPRWQIICSLIYY